MFNLISPSTYFVPKYTPTYSLIRLFIICCSMC